MFRGLLADQSVEVRTHLQVVLIGLLVMFSAAVVASGAAAILITRKFTRVVEDLYAATQSVDAGDFSHSIVIRGRDQMSQLAHAFNVMTASVRRLLVESRERQRLQAELDIGREIQGRMFPAVHPRSPKVDVVGLCWPACTVSGDFYDFFDLPNGRVALVLGDVAGKGVSSALVMATVHSTLRSELPAMLSQTDDVGDDPRGLGTRLVRFVAGLNHRLHTKTGPEKYCTIFLAIYDERTDVLVYVDAGHPPPVPLSGVAPRRLDVTGTVIGLLPDGECGFDVRSFSAGDTLVAFSDGTTEAQDGSGEMFGEERLAALAHQETRHTLEQAALNILETVKRWSGAADPEDDMTVLIVRRLDESAPASADRGARAPEGA